MLRYCALSMLCDEWITNVTIKLEFNIPYSRTTKFTIFEQK